MAGKIENTSTNGVITARLISNVIEKFNDLYDFCYDLGYENPAASRSGFWTNQNNTSTNTYGADDVRFFSSRRGFQITAGNGKVGSGTFRFGAGDFTNPPTVTMTVVSSNKKQALFPVITSTTADAVTFQIHSVGAVQAEQVTVNCLAIGGD